MRTVESSRILATSARSTTQFRAFAAKLRRQDRRPSPSPPRSGIAPSTPWIWSRRRSSSRPQPVRLLRSMRFIRLLPPSRSRLSNELIIDGHVQPGRSDYRPLAVPTPLAVSRQSDLPDLRLIKRRNSHTKSPLRHRGFPADPASLCIEAHFIEFQPGRANPTRSVCSLPPAPSRRHSVRIIGREPGHPRHRSLSRAGSACRTRRWTISDILLAIFDRCSEGGGLGEAIASLVERSAELKRELLEFSWQPPSTATAARCFGPLSEWIRRRRVGTDYRARLLPVAT